MALKEKYVVRLGPDERRQLRELIAAGKAAAQKLAHARILLKADQGDGGPAWGDAAIAQALDCGASTVARVRKRLVQQGLEAALGRKKPTGRQYRKLDGAQEAHLVALACSQPPDGRERWTLRLLADKLVELEVVQAIDPATVYRTLKKTSSSRG
jgi:transposase